MGFAIDLSILLVFSLIWLGIVAFLRLKKKADIVYVVFFSLFYFYLFKVLDLTLFQFQSLLLLKHFMPELMLRGIEAAESINLIPLGTLGLEDLKTSLLNILLLVPFGFGLPFITNFRMLKVLVSGLLLSIGIELAQFLTGSLAEITFRIADINDVLFNAVGVASGYLLFLGFMHVYRRVRFNRKMEENPFLRYIADRPQTGV
jgi:glycopeptide antibiotics resistance protein